MKHRTGNIILIGFTTSGKSTVGRALAERLEFVFKDLDLLIEEQYKRENGVFCSSREIFTRFGRLAFTLRERAALEEIRKTERTILSTGGGVIINPENRAMLQSLGSIVYLRTAPGEVYSRMEHKGFPAYFGAKPDREQVEAFWLERDPVYSALATVIIDNTQLPIAATVDAICASTVY